MFKKIRGNEFNRNILTLLTGTTIAQALPIAISPILTRMYTPEDFGVFGLFVSIAVVFGTIANANYELAIVIPEKDEDAINISALSLIIAFIMSVFLLFIAIVFNRNIIELLGNEDISIWLYFIPLVVFMTGLFNTLNYLNTRLKNYKDISRANIYKSLALAIVQLTLGFWKAGASGLVSGQIISTALGNFRLLKNIILDKKLIRSISYVEIKRMAKEYSEFPKYSLWGNLSNTFSSNVINFFITAIYSITSLGHFLLVQRILITPIRLIGTSIGQVYFQKASVEKNTSGNSKKTFNQTLKKLLILSVPTFLVMYIIIEELMAFVFGAEWRVAGEYARILIPLFFLRFVIVPLSVTIPIFKKNKFGLFWQLGMLVLTLCTFAVVYILKLDIYVFFYIYTATQSLYYIYYFIMIRKFSYYGVKENH